MSLNNYLMMMMIWLTFTCQESCLVCLHQLVALVLPIGLPPPLLLAQRYPERVEQVW